MDDKLHKIQELHESGVPYDKAYEDVMRSEQTMNYQIVEVDKETLYLLVLAIVPYEIRENIFEFIDEINLSCTRIKERKDSLPYVYGIYEIYGKNVKEDIKKVDEYIREQLAK